MQTDLKLRSLMQALVQLRCSVCFKLWAVLSIDVAPVITDLYFLTKISKEKFSCNQTSKEKILAEAIPV